MSYVLPHEGGLPRLFDERKVLALRLVSFADRNMEMKMSDAGESACTLAGR